MAEIAALAAMIFLASEDHSIARSSWAVCEKHKDELR